MFVCCSYDSLPYFEILCRLYDEQCPELLVPFVRLVAELCPWTDDGSIKRGPPVSLLVFTAHLSRSSMMFLARLQRIWIRSCRSPCLRWKAAAAARPSVHCSAACIQGWVD